MYYQIMASKIRTIMDEQALLMAQLRLLDNPDCKDGRDLANRIVENSRHLSFVVYNDDLTINEF